MRIVMWWRFDVFISLDYVIFMVVMGIGPIGCPENDIVVGVDARIAERWRHGTGLWGKCWFWRSKITERLRMMWQVRIERWRRKCRWWMGILFVFDEFLSGSFNVNQLFWVMMVASGRRPYHVLAIVDGAPIESTHQILRMVAMKQLLLVFLLLRIFHNCLEFGILSSQFGFLCVSGVCWVGSEWTAACW